MAFVKSASAVGTWTNSSYKFEMFGHSTLVCKVNKISPYNLFFETSYMTLFELTMQSLDRDSQLFENGITKEMLAKTHGIIVLDLSGTQDMTIVRTGTVRLKFPFASN